MSGYIGAKDKLARRFNTNLWGRVRNPLTRTKVKSFRGKKKSEFGIRLDEKQKLKYFYGGIREKQFKSYYTEAKRRGGNIGFTFLRLIESRLDLMVYRLNLAPTIFAARQVVSHGMINVNGQRVNVPSFQVKVGDIVKVREKYQNLVLIREHLARPERILPTYLVLNTETLEGKFDRLPERNEIVYPFEANEAMIVEFYSK